MKKYGFLIGCIFSTIMTYGQNENAQDKFVKQLFNDFKNNRIDKMMAHFIDSIFLDELIIKSKKNKEAVTEKYDKETIHEQRYTAKTLLAKSLARAYDEFTSKPTSDKLRDIEPTIKIYTIRKTPIESFGIQYNFELDDEEGEIKIPYILCDSSRKQYVIMSERVRFHLIQKEVVEIRGRDYDVLSEDMGFDEDIIVEKIPNIPPPPPVSIERTRRRANQLTDAAIMDMAPPVHKETRTMQNDVFEFPDTMAVFPGGDVAMQQFIAQNISYPRMAIESEVQGMVYVQFVVERDGTISNINVKRGIGSGCDEEAKRVIKSMPQWVPGKQKGKIVRVQYLLPIRFIMQ